MKKNEFLFQKHDKKQKELNQSSNASKDQNSQQMQVESVPEQKQERNTRENNPPSQSEAQVQQRLNQNYFKLLQSEQILNQNLQQSLIQNEANRVQEKATPQVDKLKQNQQSKQINEVVQQVKQTEPQTDKDNQTQPEENISLQELQRQARNSYMSQKRQRSEQTKFANEQFQKQKSQNLDPQKKLKVDSQQVIKKDQDQEKKHPQIFQPTQEQKKQEPLASNFMPMKINAQAQLFTQQKQNSQFKSSLNAMNNAQIPNEYSTEKQSLEELFKFSNLIQQYQAQLPQTMQRQFPQMPQQVPLLYPNINQNLIASLGLPNIPQNIEMLTATNQKLLVTIDWVKKVEMMLVQTKQDLEKLEREHFTIS